MKHLFFVLVILFTLVSAGQNSYAQDALETYEPPPLFEEPKLPPPKIKKPPVDVIDPVSKEPDKSPIIPKEKEFLVTPRVVKPIDTKSNGMKLPSAQQPRPQLIVKKPIPQIKPKSAPPEELSKKLIKNPLETETVQPQLVPSSSAPKSVMKKQIPAANEKVKLVDEPIKLLKTQVPPPKNDGVVTGPKTMPSVKKKDVMSEEIFVNDAPQINIIERAQNKDPDEPIAILSFEAVEDFPDDKSTIILVFSPQKTKLLDNMLDNDLFPLAKYLAGNKKTLDIKAYATKSDDTPNSDRRIALDRGLAIREFLVSNQIEPYRINLKSFGNNTTRQPADFVEININD